MVRLRGTALPEGTDCELYVHGDRLTESRIPEADTLGEGGFLIPGLVDVHLHPGTGDIGTPLDEEALAEHGDQCRRAGVSVIRVPGSASTLPPWFGADPRWPRVQEAGLAIAPEGRFFPDWGQQLPVDEIPAAAAVQAARSGWAKLILDWFTEDGTAYEPSVPPDVVAEATRRAHDAGGRVAAHTQHASGAAAAVHAGVDSIEHGMGLEHELLPVMAAAGTALVPTAVTFAAAAPAMADPSVPAGLRHWFEDGWQRHPDLVRAAYEAGVTILAGTDLPPGNLLDEIRWLIDAAGLSPEVAVGAASWTARHWLGLPGNLADGAPADVLVLDDDPRLDPDVLAHPRHILHRGQLVH